MALIRCPECSHEVSDTAATCPNCGYAISEMKPFEKKTTNLSTPYLSKEDKKKAILEIIGGLVLVIFGIPFVTVVIGIIVDILGVISIFTGIAKLSSKKQQGACPYCGEMLIVNAESSGAVKCPKCNNMFNKTATTLETTH